MLEKIMAYDWETMIARIIDGLKNFVAKFEAYMPVSKYGFEDQEAAWAGWSDAE